MYGVHEKKTRKETKTFHSLALTPYALQNVAKFKEVVTIPFEALTRKIHTTYRMGYMKDAILHITPIGSVVGTGNTALFCLKAQKKT